MSRWGVSRLVSFQNKSKMSPSIFKDNEDQKDVREAVTAESSGSESPNRKRLKLGQLREAKTTKHAKLRPQNSSSRKSKHNKPENTKDRWSADRYKLAEQSMLDILKDEGAVFENPISRPVLRMAARKRIGDTGLLDHLLKHIDGKVAPGGAERFRRCYNTEGVMEYWLENADLVKIKQEARVPDPNYVPPSSWWKCGGGSFQDSVCAGELRVLKAEMEKMKRDMQELVYHQREQDQANPAEDMHKELVKWKAKTDQRLMELSSSLSGMQDMYREFMKWKAKIEQQLMEISNTLNSMQALKQCNTFNSPGHPDHEGWEDWLESTNLDDIHEEDIAHILGNTDLGNIGQEAALQDNLAPPSRLKPGGSPFEDCVCARELELLKEEMAKMKRDVQELVPRRQEEDHAIVTPDSSITTNSKLDLDNSLLIFQEMFKELVKWKAKVEQQIQEISDTVSGMQASKI
ncbi:protein DYAD isoform X2 [Mangifera indica]|nr:protein DYAD isoform X2 [Mangifera indica]XP_044502877.1 protein DYAD isoform X2 [Mangifera indica]XP_044502887.1 protein DYAD isoform X2 [Mangifera indica]XP_044502895.1 protein DYAD isoform X2 [Mangifera indica]